MRFRRRVNPLSAIRAKAFHVFMSNGCPMSPTTQRAEHSSNRRRKSMLFPENRNKKEIVKSSLREWRHRVEVASLDQRDASVQPSVTISADSGESQLDSADHASAAWRTVPSGVCWLTKLSAS